MKPETREWINKAEGDLGTARREMKVTLEPNFDAACFHAQQCAEKYLKARLIEDALEAVSAAHRIRTLVRNSFGLEVF